MASPSHSLDSLSSPSPSPSPPPSRRLPLSSATALPSKPSTSAALDTDSELSELTEDDQDPSGVPDKRAASVAAASSSKPRQRPGDDGDPTPAPPHPGSSSRPARRGTHQRSLSARGAGPGRKKRSSIVPAPMWGWAESKAANSTAPAEEEEEEDLSGPPRAMEEEEEEEEDDDEVVSNNGDCFPKGRAPPTQRQPPPVSPTNRSHPHWRYPNHRAGAAKPTAFQRKREQLWTEDLRKEEEGENDDGQDDDDDEIGREDTEKLEKQTRQPPPSSKRATPPHRNGDDGDVGSASGSDYPSKKKKRPIKGRPSTSRTKKLKGSAEISNSEHPVSSKRKKNGLKVQLQQADDQDASSDASSAAGGNSTESEDEPLLPPNTTSPTSPLRSTISTLSKPLSAIAVSADALSTLAAIAEAVDLTQISAQGVASIPAPATSSEQPPASAPSSASSATATGVGALSRSRSHSPDDPKSEAEVSADEAKPLKGRGSRGGKAGRGGRGKYRGGKAAVVPTTDRKDAGLKVNGTASSTAEVSSNQTVQPSSTLPPSASTKRGPPPLDLKINTTLDDPEHRHVIDTGDQDMEVDGVADEVNDQSMQDPDASMDADEPEEEEEEEEDEDIEDEQSAQEEEVDAIDDEGADADQDGDEEAIEGEGEGDDNEADGDDDQEQENENDPDTAGVEQENDEAEEGENDEEPSPVDAEADVEDHESDLQPAHRAEALDVLATIELKFALLRERVYVEKMEGLAWEEMMVQSASHPEMLHLQKELSQRRDKRLELATRKRSYEVANAETRRKADESAVWSWWKFARDELQTDMISETSRKRRRLERDRRAVERPHPIRRIPHPPFIDMHNPPPLPNLRKIIKSYPFGSRKQNKTDIHHHHHTHSQHPRTLVYPEIATLSAMDINSDLDYLFQNRKAAAAYDMQQPPHPHQQPSSHFLSYSSHPQRNGSGIGLGLGMPNGVLPPPASSQVPASSSMGPPPPGSMMHPHQPQHGMGYDQYGDGPSYGPGGPPPPSGRVRDQYQSQGPAGPPPQGPPPSANSRENLNSYPNFAGPGGRSQPPSSHGHGGYPGDHEIGLGNTSGVGHQILPHHPYFGQGSIVPSGAGGSHAPPMPPPQQSSSSSHAPGGHHGSGGGGKALNGRRSVSPVHLVNGTAGPSSGSKTNGHWMGMGMGMPGFRHDGGGGSKGGDWDSRMTHEEDERMFRERDRKRDEREREKEREREQRDRDNERHRREYQLDMERERHREHQHMQQQRQSTLPSGGAAHHSLSHLHAGGPPTQSPGVVARHHGSHHHHHTPHHHHVVHNHHPQGASSSLPPSGSGGGAPPITHSPRDYDRQPPGHSHTAEVITLSSGKQPPSGPRERDMHTPGHWPSKSSEEHHHQSRVDYHERDRDPRDNRERERDTRKIHPHPQRQSSGPPILPFDDRVDRPMATPFVMASSQAMQQAAAGHINGSGLGSSTSSPRGGPSWNTPAATDDVPFRLPSSSSAPPSSGYLGSSHDPHARSPVQGHRYATGPPSHGRIPSSNSSGHLHRMASPPIPPPNRSRPPPSPSYSTSMSNTHHSPVTSPKPRPLSPPLPSSTAKSHLLSGPAPGPRYSPPPRLSGPGRTATPTGHQQPPSSSSGLLPSIQSDVSKNGTSSYAVGSRTASPMMPSLHAPLSGATGRPTTNGNLDRDRMERERDRDRHAVVASPRLGPHPAPSSSKLSA